MSGRLYVFDLDGTLFRGGEVLPMAVETLSELRRRGHSIRFVTNNSAAYPPALRLKLEAMGFEVELDEILTSGIVAADFLRRKGIERVFTIGDEGLKLVLEEYGVASVESNSEAVLAGICHSFNYGILDSALQAIVAGAPFLATNRDATYPLEGSRIQPGAGAIVAAIEACSGVAPRVFGKPEPDFAELILRRSDIKLEDCIVVGDRLDTDIAFGRRIGCQTYLVLTGDTNALPEGQWGGETLEGLLG